MSSPKRPTVAPPAAIAPAVAAASVSKPYPQHAVTSYSPPSPVKRLMTNVSKFRWKVPELRPRQCYSLSFIFDNKASGGTALIVERNGGGKSHTMRCSGGFTRGIIVIIVPLLALAADVFLKFVTDDATFGSVDAIHFDEDIGDDRPLRQQLSVHIICLPKLYCPSYKVLLMPSRVHSNILNCPRNGRMITRRRMILN